MRFATSPRDRVAAKCANLNGRSDPAVRDLFVATVGRYTRPTIVGRDRCNENRGRRWVGC
jgi:hypothetical protein